jgi:hemerythrin
MQLVEREAEKLISTDNQACAEMEANESALNDLFNKSQGHFSNGVISLSSVVEQANLSKRELTTDLICEMAIARSNDIKKHRALHKTLIKMLSEVALEMNEAMANRH